MQNSPFVFKREGKIWTLRFSDGSDVEEKQFSDRRGFHEYAALLANPDKRFDSFALYNEARPFVREVDASLAEVELSTVSGQEAADPEFIREQLRHKRELEDQIEIAESTGDKGSAAGLKEELSRIELYLAGASHGGRPRMLGTTPRQLAHNALKQAFLRIQRLLAANGMPQLPLHLKNMVKIEAGCAWRYSPVEQSTWETST